MEIPPSSSFMQIPGCCIFLYIAMTMETFSLEPEILASAALTKERDSTSISAGARFQWQMQNIWQPSGEHIFLETMNFCSANGNYV